MSDIKTVTTKIFAPIEDEALYEKTVLKMRQEISKGKTFDQACEILKGIDEPLRPLIRDDFLKIIIAEQHFGQGCGIDDVALFLDLPYETVAASREMIMADFDEMVTSQHSGQTPTSKLTH